MIHDRCCRLVIVGFVALAVEFPAMAADNSTAETNPVGLSDMELARKEKSLAEMANKVAKGREDLLALMEQKKRSTDAAETHRLMQEIQVAYNSLMTLTKQHRELDLEIQYRNPGRGGKIAAEGSDHQPLPNRAPAAGLEALLDRVRKTIDRHYRAYLPERVPNSSGHGESKNNESSPKNRLRLER